MSDLAAAIEYEKQQASPRVASAPVGTCAHCGESAPLLDSHGGLCIACHNIQLRTEPPTFADLARKQCNDIADMLIAKNAAYGNSALEPVRIFSKASAEEQLLVRIDDKLSRIMRGNDLHGEDTINDLIGYLVLLKIQQGAA